MDAQDSQVLHTFDPAGECDPKVNSESPAIGTQPVGRTVHSLQGRSVSRKRRRLSRSSSSSSTASSLAKVSRLSGGRRDTSDLDAGYENDADDDDDEDEDDDEEEEEEDEDDREDEDETGCEEEDERHIKSDQHVFPTEQDASCHAAGVRASASNADGGSCGEKNGEKSTPFETADLNAHRQQQQPKQHQHQQLPATNYQHYQQQQLPHQQLRHSKRPKYDYTRDQMFEIFQPWVIRTYGDRAKTKTITLKKQARIIKTLRGLEMNNPDSSKFRFWVKTKGFTTSKPKDFQDIFTHQNIPENDGCMLYAPSGGLEPGQPYKKVAVVENFFDIIYGVHVSLGSRATRHAGQKRTYRTITETYAFLPREAVTKFLSLCSQCSKLTTKVYSPKSEHKMTPRNKDDISERIPKPSVEGELQSSKTADRSQSSLRYYELLKNLYENGKSNRSRVVTPAQLTSNGAEVNPGSVRLSRPNSAISDVLPSDRAVVATASGGGGNELSVNVCASERNGSREHFPAIGLNNNRSEKGADEKRRTVPITSTYLDVTRSFGLADDDALNMVSLFYYFYGYFSMERMHNSG
uniref:Nucleolar protein 4 n=1 Tax=Anopheles christyi TaxID=43041 RepID=A0A182KFG9_9DIPT